MSRNSYARSGLPIAAVSAALLSDSGNPMETRAWTDSLEIFTPGTALVLVVVLATTGCVGGAVCVGAATGVVVAAAGA